MLNLQCNIMAIKNPYQLLEHRTFKRTFLLQTEVNVKFATAMSDTLFRERMIPYLKDYFNLDLSGKADIEANHAEVSSENEQKKFIFDLDQVRMIIGPNSYKTFNETVVPLICMIQGFIKDVAKIDSVDQLSIIKVNVWPITSEDTYSNFTNLIEYTFKRECVSDMLSYKFDESPQPIRLSKTSNNEVTENVKLDAILSAEVESKERAQLGLVLAASSKNVIIHDILSDSIVLNDIIYTGFIETISDNIIEFMSNDNLS